MVCTLLFTLAQEPNKPQKNAVLKVLSSPWKSPSWTPGRLERCSSSSSIERQTKQGFFFFCQYLVHDFLLLLHSTNSQHNLQVPTCLGNTQPLISPPHPPMSPTQVLPLPQDFVSSTNTFQASFDNVLGRFFDVVSNLGVQVLENEYLKKKKNCLGSRK